MNKLQLFSTMRKLKKNLQREQPLGEMWEYVLKHLPLHVEAESQLLQNGIGEARELALERMRELSYSVFDQEKTKISNFAHVKDLLTLRNGWISQGLNCWFKELGLIQLIAASLIYGQNVQTCIDLLNYILELPGGVVVIFQELASVKLLIHSLECIPEASKVLALLKAAAVLVTLLDHLYIKLLGYEFDNECVAFLSEVHRYSEQHDEKSQKSNAVLLLMRNDFFNDALLYIFRCKDILEFQEREIEIALLCQIYQNIFRHDDSYWSLLLAEKLTPYLKRYTEYINKDQGRYSQAIRLNLALLASYLEPYELFIHKDTTKALRENFHNRLRFATINSDIEKNKLIEYFAQYDDQRKVHEQLKEELALIGTFQKPNQNIHFIDGSIKIFRILAKVHFNFFIPYFENEVLAGVEYFAKKLATLFGALLSKNIQVEYMIQKLHNAAQIIRDYFDVSCHTLDLIYERLRYRVDLGSDTQFHSSDLSRILIEYYVALRKVCSNPEDYSSFQVFGKDSNSAYSVPEKAKNFIAKVVECLSMVVQINSIPEDPQRAHLGHVQSQQELQNLLQVLYIRAFRNIEEQPLVVELMAELIGLERLRKTANTVLFRPMKKNDDEFEQYTKQGDLGFMLDEMAEATCFENLISATVSTHSRKSFYKLQWALLDSYDLTTIQNLFKIYDDLIKGHQQKIRTLRAQENMDLYLKKRYDWMLRLLLTLQCLAQCATNAGFKYFINYEHLDDEVIKIYKLIDDEIEYAKEQNDYLLLLLNIRHTILQFFTHIVDHENTFLPESKSTYIEDIPHITHQQALLRQLANIPINQIKLYPQNKFEKINFITLIKAVEVLKNCAKNIVGQIIILYSDYSETVFKAKPILNLSGVVELVLQILDQEDTQQSKLHYQLIQTFTNLLLRLSYQPVQKAIHNGEVRRKAINAILFTKGSKFENYQDLLNHLHQKLTNYRQQQVVVAYLLKHFSSSSSSNPNDDRDNNVKLPNEPRRPEKVFELYKRPQPQVQQNPLVRFFQESVLDQSTIKYSTLSLNYATPWELAFENKKPQPTQIKYPDDVLFPEEIFKQVELRTDYYQTINDMFTLFDRQSTQFKERQALAKHINIKVVESFDPYERRMPMYVYPPPQAQHPQYGGPPPQEQMPGFLDDLRLQQQRIATTMPFVNRPADDDPRLRRQHQAPIQTPIQPQQIPTPTPVQPQQVPTPQRPQQVAPQTPSNGEQEMAQTINEMTDQEKVILRNYLKSQDPRRERQLKEHAKVYPGIARFLQAIKRQQQFQH